MHCSQKVVVVFVLLVAGLSAGCGSSPLAPGTLVQSTLSREASPQVAAVDRASQSEGNTAFAFNVYRRLAAHPGNVVFSPISISAALAMTWAGARTSTEEQMASALELRLPQDRLHPYFNELDLALNSRGQGARGKDGKEFRLRVVNSLWGQQGYEFLPSFLDVLAVNYGAGLHLLDFEKPEAAADAINDWVAEQTEDRIQKLLSPELLKDPTALVLTNAVYLNAMWLHTFEKSETRDRDFTLGNGDVVRVSMMRQQATFRMATGYYQEATDRCGASMRCGSNGYRAIELPYEGEQVAMLILVPSGRALDSLEAALSPSALAKILGALEAQNVELTMPRWTFRSPSIALRPELEALGMKDAFDLSRADFSGMDGTRRLFVSSVVHQAFVAVDEAGTEAAAATGVVIGVTAMPPPPVSFTVDEPFLYLIRDVPTGTILFVGRCADPR